MGRHFIRVWACCSAVAFLGGCGRPSTANIELRKQNQSLRDELAALSREKDGLAGSLDAAQNLSPATRPIFSAEQLQTLFTAHDLALGRLTGPSDLDPAVAGDEGLKIYVVPTDDQGDPIKSAGTFSVEAFDLSAQDRQRIGQWEFDAPRSRSAWQGQGLLYCYVLTCPWQTVPTSTDLTVKIAFVDALTGRRLTKQAQVKVRVAPATAPSVH